VLATTKAQYTYVATFGGSNGITGEVTVDRGTVMVDLDLSAMPDLPGDFATCTDGGMSYHIHESYAHNFTDDSIGITDCGSAYTGGHWDPWQACGAASGNPYCGDGTGTTCIPKSDYSADFPAMPFSAEVGDWSSKYGKLVLDENYMLYANVSNFYEVAPWDMEGFSVVFHCNDGSRAFCAPFVESTTMTTESIPSQESDVTFALASFDVLSDGSYIILGNNGYVYLRLYAESVYTDEATDGCASFEYGVFEAGDSVLMSSMLGSNCDDYVGDFYDPTHQCPSFSGSEYCTDGKLCNDANYAYDCDWDDRYSCAPGDLSGYMAPFENPATAVFSYIAPAPSSYLFPLTSDLVGKVMAIYCNEDDQADLTVFACAPIVDANATTMAPTMAPTFDPTMTPTTEDNSGASYLSFVAGALVSSMLAMW